MTHEQFRRKGQHTLIRLDDQRSKGHRLALTQAPIQADAGIPGVMDLSAQAKGVIDLIGLAGPDQGMDALDALGKKRFAHLRRPSHRPRWRRKTGGLSRQPRLDLRARAVRQLTKHQKTQCPRRVIWGQRNALKAHAPFVVSQEDRVQPRRQVSGHGRPNAG